VYPFLSAAGSLAMALVMGAVGAVSIAQSSSRRRRMFAAIPLLFAVQQGAQVVVWSTMGDPARAILHRVATNLFLGVGLVVWPTWLPLALASVERRTVRLWGLVSLARFGTVVSTCAAVLLLRWQPSAHVVAGAIRYDLPPGLGLDLSDRLICLWAFAAPAVIPLFVSTAGLMRTMGLTLVAALVVAAGVPPDARTSVWCFFAAVLSCLVLVAEWRERRCATPSRTMDPRASAWS
jgi:hypothetical protein